VHAGRQSSARWRTAAWTTTGLAVAAALVDLWGNRYNLNPDGISYIEMARNAVAGGPHALINGLWSPGYPSLLMSVVQLTGRNPANDVPSLHLVNFVLYVMSLGLFVRLLAGVSPEPNDDGVSPGRHGVPLGAMAFAMIVLQSIGMGLLTPDAGVLFCILASAVCCIELESSAHPWHLPVILGVVLGAGYWMKGVLLPLNLLLLAGLMLVPPRIHRARRKIALAAAVFAMTVLPLFVMVSLKVGRPSPGEVGRLNYAWQTSDVTPYVGWVGDASGRNGVPSHPPRVLQAHPQTLEFAAPVQGTYPLWYDPAYWYAGLRVHVDLHAQWRLLKRGVADVAVILGDQWILLVVVVALWLATDARVAPRGASRMPLVLGAWSTAATLLYALIHVEARYLAGFLVLGTFLAWTALTRRRRRRGFQLVMTASVAAMTASVGLHLWQNTGGFDRDYRPDYLVAADTMRALGLAPGSRVAAVGDAFEQYAAFAAGTPIAAQVMDSGSFWAATPPERSELERRLATVGVKALLANNVAAEMVAEGWHIIQRDDASNLGVLMLPAP
jgi:hypothetical protein